MNVRGACKRCGAIEAELALLRAENAELKAHLRELDKLCTLQEADLERYRKECDRLQPNRPERVPTDQLQLAFAEVLASFSAPANDAPAEDASSAEANAETPDASVPPARTIPDRKKKGHGRRDLLLANLPVVESVIDPAEVIAAGREGFVRIGEEVAERLAYRRAAFFVLRQIRTKWATVQKGAPRTIVCAPIPPCSWPRTMADPSAVVQIILAKYDMSLPLHRQERASPRLGFYLPRSTQCDWLGEGYGYVYRVVDAMMAEACATAFCIATDATGAPVRMRGQCAPWHVFVFIADRDHVVFRAVREHSGASMVELLRGFRGHLLSDAAPIYDVLHREHGITEVCCWFHLRRYFWRCRDTDPALALEALAIISRLFAVDGTTHEVPMPARTRERARGVMPILDLFDKWIERTRPRAHPRTPLAAALTYYDNQRDGLRRFLTDGRLRLDNNISEQQLRNVVLGRRNWTFFENPNGLRWYAVYRSLIASCALHSVEPQQYLEEILRLAPHWSKGRMLELSPKYWAITRAGLSTAEQEIIRRPWDDAKVRDESDVPSTAAVA